MRQHGARQYSTRWRNFLLDDNKSFNGREKEETISDLSGGTNQDKWRKRNNVVENFLSFCDCYCDVGCITKLRCCKICRYMNACNYYLISDLQLLVKQSFYEQHLNPQEESPSNLCLEGSWDNYRWESLKSCRHIAKVYLKFQVKHSADSGPGILRLKEGSTRAFLWFTKIWVFMRLIWPHVMAYIFTNSLINP